MATYCQLQFCDAVDHKEGQVGRRRHGGIPGEFRSQLTYLGLELSVMSPDSQPGAADRHAVAGRGNLNRLPATDYRLPSLHFFVAPADNRG